MLTVTLKAGDAAQAGTPLAVTGNDRAM